jgi:hypothetical protein
LHIWSIDKLITATLNRAHGAAGERLIHRAEIRRAGELSVTAANVIAKLQKSATPKTTKMLVYRRIRDDLVERS